MPEKATGDLLADQVKPGSLHRWPGEESVGLYPGLVVSDGEHSRVTGSITVGRTRLPLWAFISEVIRHGFADGAQDYYSVTNWEDFGEDDAAEFFYQLTELRGEFGRLLLVLADAERCESNGGGRRAWYQTKRHRKRVGDQLRRCLAVLEAQDRSASDDTQLDSEGEEA